MQGMLFSSVNFGNVNVFLCISRRINTVNGHVRIIELVYIDCINLFVTGLELSVSYCAKAWRNKVSICLFYVPEDE